MKGLRTSFRSKLTLLTIVPLAIAQVVTLFAVMKTVEADVRARAEQSLVIGATVVGEFLASRGEQLRTSVEVMSSDFGLKEATATGDAGTIRSALENHSRRVRADMAMVVGLNGELIASTIAAGKLPPSLIESEETTTLLDGDAYHVFVVPLRAPVTIAWVVLGFRVDEALAARLASLTGLDVAIVSPDSDNGDIIASTSSTIPATSKPASLYGDPELLLARIPFVGDSDEVEIVLQRSLSEAMLPYVEARRGLLLFGLALLVLVAIAATVFSSTIARPLRTLTVAAQRMIAGNYEGRIEVAADDELGDLATSFNAMRSAIAEREHRISHQALHDDLTDLPNRYKVLQLLSDAISNASSDDRRMAVLSMCIAGMDEISSTLGHWASDELIVQAARHLQANLEAGDILGRVGTNEFMLVLPGFDVDQALARVDRIEQILASGVTLERSDISLQVEAGIATYPQHGSIAADLARFASIARSDAHANQDRVRIYDSGREDVFVRRLRVVNDLRSALRLREIEVWYQPKVGLHDGKACGVEALVRWQHPELGFLSPDEFIPAAEQAGTIVHLTRHVLSDAVRQCRHWLDGGFELEVSVNISTRDLLDEYLPYHVLQILKDHDVRPNLLTLEVTESSIMRDLSRALLVLECLRDIGVRISIDDFGTGHSSLAQLKNMPVHELKIDKSFFRDICNDSQNEAIVHATVGLAHNIGLSVVAEGVEDESAMRRATQLGCEVAQGYFLSKPIPPAELTAWLAGFEPKVYSERRNSTRAFA